MDSSGNEWLRLANTVGFPIWVAVFVLVRLDKTLKDMTLAFTNLTKELERHRKG